LYDPGNNQKTGIGGNRNGRFSVSVIVNMHASICELVPDFV